MNCKTIIPEGKSTEALVTELRYTVATTRAEGGELLMISIPETGDGQAKKTRALATRILKTMKKEGLIQFYATKESFDSSSTEAKFLLNKYSHVFSESHNPISANILYVKI